MDPEDLSLLLPASLQLVLFKFELKLNLNKKFIRLELENFCQYHLTGGFYVKDQIISNGLLYILVVQIAKCIHLRNRLL